MGEGTKYDQGKVRMDLVPWNVVREIAKVLTFGAGKYGDYNWQGLDEPKDQARVFAALHRHLTAWWEGEAADEETGLSHLAHAGCCLFFLLWFELSGRPYRQDERPMTADEIQSAMTAYYRSKVVESERS